MPKFFSPVLRSSLYRLVVVCFCLHLPSTSFALIEPGTPASYELAASYLASGELQSARIEAKNAVQQNPDHLPSRILLGTIYVQNGEGASAEKELTIALRAGADEEQIALPLGNAFLLQRKYQRILNEIKISDPRARYRAELMTLHGRAMAGLGRADDAVRMYEEAIGAYPNSTSPLIAYAGLLRTLGEYEAAEAHIDKALRLQARSTEAWYEKGLLRSIAGDEAGAEESFNQVLELAPTHVRARIARAKLYSATDDSQRAYEDLQIVRTAKPLDPEAALLSAQILLKLNRKSEADEELKVALEILEKISPTTLRRQPGLLKVAAAVEFLSGHFEQAERHLTQYLKLKPLDLSSIKLLGQLRLQQDKAIEAEEILLSGYSLNPKDPEILFLMGDAYLRMGRYVQASSVLADAVRYYPDSAVIRSRLALSKMGLGQTDAAIDLLEQANASQDRNSANSGVILAVTLVKQGDLDRALDVARALTIRYPEAPIMQNLLGVVYLARRDAASAYSAFEAAERLDDAFSPALHNLAMIDEKFGRLERAAKRYEQILRIDPKFTQAAVSLARMATAQGDVERARTLLQGVTDVDGNNLEAGIQFVDLYLATGELEKAEHTAATLKQKHETDPDALEAYARAKVALGKRSEAVTAYRKATLYAGLSADTLLRLGKLLWELDDFPGAESAFQMAAKTNSSTRANESLARLYVRIANYDKAKIYAKRVRDESEGQPIGYNLLGHVAMAEKDYPAALGYYQAAFDVSANTESLFGLYRVHLATRDIDKALAVLQEWLGNNSGDNFVRRNLALGYLRLGRREEARREFEYLVGNGDRGAVVLTSLANIYVLERDPRAKSLAVDALRQNPGWPAALDTYGWILVSEGNAEQGLNYLREAVSRDGNPIIRYHLAVALAKLGRTADSRVELNAVIRTTKSAALREKAEALQETL